MRRFVYGLRLIIRGITVPVLGIGPLIIAIIVLYNLYKFSSWSAIVLFIVSLFCTVFGISMIAYVGKCITDSVDKDHKSKCLFFNKRNKLANLCKDWIEDNNISDCPLNVITFLDGNHLLDIDRVNEFIKSNEAD